MQNTSTRSQLRHGLLTNFPSVSLYLSLPYYSLIFPLSKLSFPYSSTCIPFSLFSPSVSFSFPRWPLALSGVFILLSWLVGSRLTRVFFCFRKPISLISHSDVRYRGILAGIDPVASTIQLSNVYSMGTESRRPPAEFIPPVQEPYQYIIFRASEVKDLAVDEPVPQRNVHDDPAVLGASAPGPVPPAGYSPYPAPAQAVGAPPGAPVPPQQQPQQPMQPQQNYPRGQQPQAKPAGAQASPQVAQAPAQPQQVPQQTQPQQPRANAGGNTNRRTGGGTSVQNAAASLETVERALGDLRISNAQNGAGTVTGGGRGGGRRNGGGRQHPVEQIKVPTTDFDFESDSTEAGAEGEKKPAPAYNPKSSFFDSLSSSTSTPPGGSIPSGGGRGGRRGGPGGGSAGRNRREEERERNVATFGEPGGVGLMGPGAYVGGWGGYGKRGGRPRRGGASGQGGHGVSARG
ncbi:hypothetical protein AN958_00732 [Leucoagaricus sp. SymC.cos]|nr:hypothetical protein AN958_00732 [Leucoagaricus sp. SymC.cos]